MTRTALPFFHRLRRDHRGNVAILAGLAMVGVVGVGAAVVDFGNVFNAQRSLQASTDSAALAGAQNVTAGTAVATAATYATNNNSHANLTATMASGYPITKCFVSVDPACIVSSPPNGIVVKQQVNVPTYFAGVFGISSVSLSATAAAGANGGKPQPLDVMIVLDTTASMSSTTDLSCRGYDASVPTTPKKIDCALAGVRALLTGFWPTEDHVGLMVFPGVTSGTVANDYDCLSSNPTIVGYDDTPSPVYQIITLSADYRSSNTAPLDTSVNIVKAARGGTVSCRQGIVAVGGKGTYFAAAIAAAQTALTNSGRSNVQKSIILLGDGDANASATTTPRQISTVHAANECHQAITAAQAARTAGIWVYSIAYTASTAASSCSTDSPAVTACSTMQQIAQIGTSDRSRFYSSTAACLSPHSVVDIIPIFQHIGLDMTSPRLLPENAL